MQKHVVEALFRDVSLTAQAIHSYDDFVSRIVPEVVQNHRPVEVRSEFSFEGPTHVIRLDGVRYGVPSCMEKNNDIRRYTPMEARNRDLMYSAPMFVNIKYTHSNDQGERVTDEYNDVYLARMPVMFRSSLCSSSRDKDYAQGECPHDPGGYFIVNGREKTLVVQERISPNIMFCFSPTECLYHAEYDPIAHRVATLRIKTRKFGASPYRVTLPGVEVEIPIVILFRALGDVEDQWQLHIDQDDFRASMSDAACAVTQAEALAWMGKYTEDPAAALARQVYPNVLPAKKTLQLALQWKKYLDCLHKRQPFDDRDQARAQTNGEARGKKKVRVIDYNVCLKSFALNGQYGSPSGHALAP